MMSREDLEKVVNNIKSSIDETNSALISDDLVSIVTAYDSLIADNDAKSSEIKTLKTDKDNLIKVNGQLFQKVGFGKEEKPTIQKEEPAEEVIELSDIINEKGELI